MSYDAESARVMWIREPEALLCEIGELLRRIGFARLIPGIEKTYNDVAACYRGENPEFRESNTRYHDLAHTEGVFLAAARLLHGAIQDRQRVAEVDVSLALTAALFHDTGYLQHREDTQGTGAKYAQGHERRSIQVLERYLSREGVPEVQRSACTQLIACTMLAVTPRHIRFRSESTAFAACVVGTADLLAQLADRLYLEKLLLLYGEFQEAGSALYNTELELLKSTENFYRVLAKKRMEEDLGNVAQHMRSHFRERWGLDRDLYRESIEKNLEYLHGVLERDREHYRDYLRRGGIVQGMDGNGS